MRMSHIDSQGWVGIDRDDPAVRRLRAELAARNGLPGLEVVAHDDVERACRLLHRDGFVVVAQVLDDARLARLSAGVEREVAAILALDGERGGNRGSHRYSFGGASRSGQLLHHPEWAMLVDLPRLTPIIEAIFGSPDYHCCGAGGDFCLPGAVGYQPLHADIGDRRVVGTHSDGSGGRRTLGSFADPSGRLTLRDLPPPLIVCNFPTIDFTPLNGPVRQIPGTQNSRQPIPALAQEPDWMRYATVCPVAAGSVIIRDARAWHGGTPNLSESVRAMPNVEFFAPWYIAPKPRSMPFEVWQTLSPHGRHLCRYVVADSSATLPTGYHTRYGFSPFE